MMFLVSALPLFIFRETPPLYPIVVMQKLIILELSFVYPTQLFPLCSHTNVIAITLNT